ncbi:hypothetical protein [Flocculibacter collagenilyticus]|uniref:hypothetical protein n=1 Tax=Flocculibacter collagenilyticus TaxID=2744479 RepID=UPI0018F30A91|nr:hypothetical protein [Flocculibacter collagenilyticus]
MRILIILASVLLSACTVVAPNYQVSLDNTQKLKLASLNKMDVGTIKDSKKVNKLSLRGSSFVSPIEKSFGKYLESALKQELEQAKLYSSVSNIQVEGVLLKNNIDISGFSIGEGDMTVKFTVKQDEKVTYQKTLSAKHEWDSSFVGAVAIPNGQINYPVIIQKLLGELFTDPEFIAATQA